ncbi:NAD(P)/FAD-dependent oxidoreductase [Candidatus Poriferisodalis sp.]|uniref:NAD(P)/FAD-dependent oxidoreductase n=1 Tax=Candidatus Poriferisodalis sp. TaxID=3101277 RepID=UPI003B02C6B6
MSPSISPAKHTVDCDAVVIGAGVIGAAITYELALRGWRVVGVDRNQGAGLGSTSASSAIVRFTYSTRAGVAMSYEGLQYWLRWADYVGEVDEAGHAALTQCGMMTLLSGDGRHLLPVPHFEALGVPYEIWDHDDAVARLRHFDLSRFGPPRRSADPEFWAEPTAQLAGALWTPEAGYVSDPQLAAHNLRLAAESAGAEFRFGATVTGIAAQGGRTEGVALCDGTAVRAPVVVNAAGPHSSAVNALAGVLGDMSISTRPLRKEVYHVPAPPGVDFEQEGATIADDDTGCYVRPEVGNNMLLGSLELDLADLEWLSAAEIDGCSQDLSRERWETHVLRFARRMPALGLPHQPRGIVGIYDVADDWIPIYDRTSLDGYYVAIGTSGNQFKNAAVAGHCMAELIGAVETGHDHDDEPVVVAGKHTGFEIDLGTFSRTRPRHSSSMSVHG